MVLLTLLVSPSVFNIYGLCIKLEAEVHRAATKHATQTLSSPTTPPPISSCPNLSQVAAALIQLHCLICHTHLFIYTCICA